MDSVGGETCWVEKFEERESDGSVGGLVSRLPAKAGQGGEGEKQRGGCHHQR